MLNAFLIKQLQAGIFFERALFKSTFTTVSSLFFCIVLAYCSFLVRYHQRLSFSAALLRETVCRKVYRVTYVLGQCYACEPLCVCMCVR